MLASICAEELIEVKALIAGIDIALGAIKARVMRMLTGVVFMIFNSVV